MANKIYRTVIQYEILSEEKIEGSIDLETIARECNEGSWSGRGLESIVENEELTGMDAITAIKDQGSDPEFFKMTSEGKDIDEEDDLNKTMDKCRDKNF